jgi:ABC-2 type transport system ATP-binding protein
MGSTAATALETIELSKSYPVGFFGRTSRPVLRGLTLRVERGEVFGYLGPNGAGKTTTLKILTGIVFADSGQVNVLGVPHQDPAWRARTGFLPEHPYFYDYLTPLEYLDYAGRLFDMPPSVRRERSWMLLERVGLLRSAKVPMRRFSKGMVQRLGIAQALVNDPELVLLDEPMSGLDPVGRRAVRDLIRSLQAEGKTVFFSTHILSDAEALCDRVAVLRAGRLIGVGDLDSLLNVGTSHVEVVLSGLADAAAQGLGPRCHPLGSGRFRLDVEEGTLEGVLSRALGAGGRIHAVQTVRQSLEDYFFKEMGGAEAGGWTWDD